MDEPKRGAEGRRGVSTMAMGLESIQLRIAALAERGADDELALKQAELARKSALVQAERDRQAARGRCDVIPLPRVATQPFRSELTIERHPLFVVNSFKGDSWTFQRTVSHPDSGEPVTQLVRVGKEVSAGRSFGVLKQVHQEVLYKLLKLWSDQGYPLAKDPSGTVWGSLKTTAYDLVTTIRGDDAEHHYDRVRQLLREMVAIPIVIENAYTWQGLADRASFSLLNGVTWNERHLDPKTRRPVGHGVSEVKILFSELVTHGFLDKNVKQLLLAPYESLGKEGKGRQPEIAKLLYPMLDYELATKDFYHCALTALAARLGLAEQPYKSIRVRPFQAAIKMLQGVPLHAEAFQLRLGLKEAVDGRDYILEARRVARKQLSLPLGQEE